eukprot:5100191-Prymnesium_polylepis.1
MSSSLLLEISLPSTLNRKRNDCRYSSETSDISGRLVTFAVSLCLGREPLHRPGRGAHVDSVCCAGELGVGNKDGTSSPISPPSPASESFIRDRQRAVRCFPRLPCPLTAPPFLG